MSVSNHKPRQPNVAVQRRINALGIGQRMQDLPEELWHKSFRYYVKEDPNRKGGPNLRIIRLDPQQPSLTVTGYIFNKFVHPYEDRFITPREAARLQGFPDNLEFKGTITSVRQQIGDAVPVELGTAVFKRILFAACQQYPDRDDFNALSLFSGAGGFDVAIERVSQDDTANLSTFACVESESDRCETLKSYFKNKIHIFNEDINNIEARNVLEQCNRTEAQVDLIYGGPPCQSFSQAGKQKGKKDPRGILIFEFLQFVSDIKPAYFVMENVPNLKGINQGKLLAEIVAEMKDIGYDIEYDILTASEFGSPQKRRRFIFIGTRNDIEYKAKLPEITHGNTMFLKPIKTVEDAFRGLPSTDFIPMKVSPVKIE